MKTIEINSAKNTFLLTLLFSLFLMAFSPKLGLDSYEIYLNDKLVLKQYVNQPLNLRTLQLGKANPQDQLWIKYTHCNKEGAGGNRTIVLKDEKGHQLTQWKFANTGSDNQPMKVSVADLLRLEKEHTGHQISLHYQSNELQNSELLAFLKY